MQFHGNQPLAAQQSTLPTAACHVHSNRTLVKDSAGHSDAANTVNQQPIQKQPQQMYGLGQSKSNQPNHYSTRPNSENASAQSHITSEQTAQQSTLTTVPNNRVDGGGTANQRGSSASNTVNSNRIDWKITEFQMNSMWYFRFNLMHRRQIMARAITRMEEAQMATVMQGIRWIESIFFWIARNKTNMFGKIISDGKWSKHCQSATSCTKIIGKTANVWCIATIGLSKWAANAFYVRTFTDTLLMSAQSGNRKWTVPHRYTKDGAAKHIDDSTKQSRQWKWIRQSSYLWCAEHGKIEWFRVRMRLIEK